MRKPRLLPLLSLSASVVLAGVLPTNTGCTSSLAVLQCTSNDVECLCAHYEEVKEVYTQCAVAKDVRLEHASYELVEFAYLCGKNEVDSSTFEHGLLKRGVKRSIGSFFSNLLGIGDPDPTPTPDPDDGRPGRPTLTDVPTPAEPTADPSSGSDDSTSSSVSATTVSPILRSSIVETSTKTPTHDRTTSSTPVERTSTTPTSTPTTSSTPTKTPITTSSTSQPSSSTIPTSSSVFSTSLSLHGIVTPSLSSTLSQASSTIELGSASSSATSPATSPSSKKTSPGVIAVAVIFSLIGVGLIIWLAFMLIRKHNRDKRLREQIEEDIRADTLLYPEPKLPNIYSGSGAATGAGAGAAIGAAAAAGAPRRQNSGNSDGVSEISEVRSGPPVRLSFETALGESNFDYKRSRGMVNDGPTQAAAIPSSRTGGPQAGWGRNQNQKNLHHLNYEQQTDYGNPGLRFGGAAPGPGGPQPMPSAFMPYRPPGAVDRQGPPVGGVYGRGRQPQQPYGFRPNQQHQLPPSLIAGQTIDEKAEYQNQQQSAAAGLVAPPRRYPNYDPLLSPSSPEPSFPPLNQRPKLHVVNRTPTPSDSPNPAQSAGGTNSSGGVSASTTGPFSPAYGTPIDISGAHAIPIAGTGRGNLVDVGQQQRYGSDVSDQKVNIPEVKRKMVGGDGRP
jgi:hypothetical protein